MEAEFIGTGSAISFQTVRERVVDALEWARVEMCAQGLNSPLIVPMLGNPIEQVKAPDILNRRFAGEGLEIRVVPIELPIDGFDEGCRFLQNEPDVIAMVVTIPFKVRARELCDTVDRCARLADAVNLMTRGKNDGWLGTMTDGIGFVAAMKTAGVLPIGRKAYMAGAGGAGSGIAVELILRGLASLDVYDPDRSKADRLETVLGARSLSSPPESLAGYDLLINASPQGLKPVDPLPFDPSAASRGAFVGDVVAEPELTPLREKAKTLGMNSIGGVDMVNGQIDALYEGIVQAAADQG